MFHLIRKDIILQKKSLMILLPVLFVYLTVNISYIWPGFLFSIVIIMNAFSMDEKARINTLLNSLPYTRREIVSSKYIGVLIFTLIVVFTIFIGNLIIHGELTTWIDLMFIVCLVMVSASFIFPFSYQFKSQYLFKGSLILLGIYMVLVNTLFRNLNDIIRECVRILLSLQNLNVYFLILFSVMILYVCSWLLSIRIYKNKVF
ncbi:ABC-2 transporter permease [Bacillus mojavensis]|uniref:ABC-2 transporter permease n=1 Tax=Bacillus mojavensis TaxID=72360 RepID=UPI002DBB1409|nr:ABC-2 transporter permease [Bacillus mojavensis]MEC1292528.1 ABC-2 transporter permease [Bacillus mojavensis]MEC1633988.1 ABC-2 transporter permease [Bacillus mojavensis]MEC1703285.1 ABC-2 transporter permease [Bacillus mojavensis]MEC5247979.1 ABC-2 transporter permease [Bacillus mojavensis]